MALERYIVPISGAQPTNDEIKCGLVWLLSRSESDLHIAVPDAQTRATLFGIIATWDPGIAKALRTNGIIKFTNARLTISTFQPYVQATPNGACLLVWGDTGQAQAVEKRLGSIGAICVIPYSNTLSGWIASNGPDEVDCAELMLPKETSSTDENADSSAEET